MKSPEQIAQETLDAHAIKPQMNDSLKAACADAKIRHGERFDSSTIEATDVSIRDHFRGPRVIIEDSSGFRRAGVVGMTTGWKPALLLIHRSSDMGSWDVLGPNDRLIAVKQGARYINPITGETEKVNR